MNQTTRISPQGLARHEAQVARDLEALNLPPRNWVPALLRDGTTMLDVVVIGAGMNGIAAAGGLIFKGIRNIAVLEESAPGQEGPWVTTARMDTLRSPKTLPGPCFGIPSLTFRAWYEASFGAEAWEGLYKIHNATWQDYLGWLQRTLRLPIEYGARVTRISPADGLLRLCLSDGRSLLARRTVLATGRAGAGGLHMPGFVAPDLFPDRAALAPTPIDFAALRGRSIGLIGGGASAWDNAAAALEAGAAEAHLYVRRATLPQINKGRGSTNPGFHLAWDALSLAERWNLVTYMHDAQAPPPHETVKRALRLPGFRIHLATPVRAARRSDAGVVLDLGGRQVTHDFLIIGTGFVVNLDRVPELADFAPHIARWQDRYTPPEVLRRPELAAFPFLGTGFELQPRDATAPAELGLIHLMNYGAHATHGGIASDIPGVAVAGERVSLAIARHLFEASIGALRGELDAFDEPELEGTPFFVPR